PPQVVDVRTNAEWNAGHIEGALHLVLDDLTKNASRVPKDRELVVVCKSGYRSSIAASLLRSAGVGGGAALSGGVAAGGWWAGGGGVGGGGGRGGSGVALS